MRDLARRPEMERRELFRATAQAMRVHEAIIEKDFWVCWVLDCLFQDSPWKDRMAFKGGTSLSKVYGAIERFSEDIDLILDWRLLGYAEDEPWEERSPTKQDAFGKEANPRAAEFLTQDFVPALNKDLKGRVEGGIGVAANGLDVFLQYPRAFTLEAIHPQIRLEMGPLAAWAPNEEKAIRPYAADWFPALFVRPHAMVRTIVLERTFWEKAALICPMFCASASERVYQPWEASMTAPGVRSALCTVRSVTCPTRAPRGSLIATATSNA